MKDSTVKDNKNAFFKYANSKRRTRDNTGLLLDELSHLTNRDIDKAETCNGFFTSVFNTSDRPWDPQSPVLEDCDWGNDKPSAHPELVQDLPLQLDVKKPMRPGEIHPRVLKELADVIRGGRCLHYFSTVLRVWRGPSQLETWQILSQFSRVRRETLIIIGLSSLISVTGKIIENVTLGVTESHLRDNTGIGHSHHRSLK